MLTAHVGIERWVSNNVSGILRSQDGGIKNWFEITDLEISARIEYKKTGSNIREQKFSRIRIRNWLAIIG
jgi:hypothetical protein